MPVIELLRNGILKEHLLEQWLGGRPGRDYHLLGADGSPTVVGYERRGERIITKAIGDGRVPLRSALPVPRSTAHVHVKTLAPGGLRHHRLCERTDVQAYCLDLLRCGSRRPQRPAWLSPRAASLPAPQVQDYVAMVRTIMSRDKVPARRGVVLSITRLEAPSGPPLVDSTTEPSDNPARRRLKSPPAHLSSRDVFQVTSPKYGPFHYVLVQSNEGEGGYPIGGYLFLPAPGERHVYLATFNVGPMDTRYRARCKNGHHAEIQLTRFVHHQPPTWQRRLSAVFISNHSRSRQRGGYSPCNACCDDLAKFLMGLHRLKAPARVAATLAWQERYSGGAVCGHPTDDTGLGMLRRSGWVLPDPLPTTVQEIAVGHPDLAPVARRPFAGATP